MVAGGGGGAGYDGDCVPGDQPGGDGGGLTGAAAVTCSAVLASFGYTAFPATGGTQVGGGSGGSMPGPFVYTAGSAGTPGTGGNALAPDPGIGGGGGGGYWGGGGACWTGGGGGSSYTDPAAFGVTHTPGYQSGNGEIDICLVDPGIISGIYPICPGLTEPLRESIAGGVWSSSNLAVATIDPATGVVTSVGGGTATITYTISTACAVAYATKVFRVINPPAPVVGTNPACAGSTYSFTDATPGGRWSITGSSFASVGSASGIVTAIAAGVATVTYTEPVAGCFSTFSFNVNGITGPTDVCNGLSVPLNYVVGPGTWSSSNPAVAVVGSASGIVTGISIGTATISYSNLVCPEAVLMHVNPIAPNVGPDSICVKGTSYVTNIIGGGNWTSSDPSVAKVSAVSGLVTGVSVGTAVMSYITPTGCLSANMVRVIAPPPAIKGFPEVCPGNTTRLSDSLTGGIWSSLNAAVAAIDPVSGVVTGKYADTASVLYTIRPGCSAFVKVIVNPLPFAITGPDTLCPGIVDTLHDASIGGVWTTTTPLQDTIVDSTGRITTRKPGMAMITYTLPTGCATSRSLYIYPIPIPPITYDPYTNTFYAPKGYPSYQWYDSISGLIPHATSPTLAATYPQWYYVVITDTNGCKAPSDVYHHDTRKVGLENVGASGISIYPNPFSGMIYIESPVNVRAVICGVDGKIEMEQRDAKQLDVSRLANAVYFVSLYDDSGRLLAVRKLVKDQ